MNLSPALQQKIEQIATLQGISPEQFVSQTLTAKVSALKQQLLNPSGTALFSDSVESDSGESNLRVQDGILVFDTESLDSIDFNQLIEQSRERGWEQLSL